MNDNELNEFLRHQIYLDRLATGQLNAVVYPSLEESLKAVVDILKVKGLPTSPSQLSALAAAIQKQILSDKGFATLTLDMEKMAEYEAAYQADLSARAYELAVVSPAAGAATELATAAIMTLTSGARVDAGLWGEFIQSNLLSRADQIDSIVKSGYSRNATIAEISNDIQEAYNGTIRRDAESLARTGYIHYASNANEAMILANADLLDEYYYVVTFDNRTSPICQGITRFNSEGNRFKVGDPRAPMPPLHFGCRTRRIGVPKAWEPQGTRSAVGGVDTKEAAAKFERRDASGKKVKYRGRKDLDTFTAGQIKASTTYESWLKSQPDWFIDDSLGVRRAALFRKGVPLSRFSDMTGKPLTLAQIAEREK